MFAAHRRIGIYCQSSKPIPFFFQIFVDVLLPMNTILNSKEHLVGISATSFLYFGSCFGVFLFVFS
jgi:hypothetical protein